MQKVTVKNLGELNRLVAEMREPKPDVSTKNRLGIAVGSSAEWRWFTDTATGKVVFNPSLHYAADMNAAMVLWGELPHTRRLTDHGNGDVCVEWSDDFSEAWGSTEAVAICLAWLALKGIEAVLCE